MNNEKMFLLKKIVTPFLMPLSACLLLALMGVFFLWFTRKQKTGKVLITVCTLLLGLFSYGVVSDTLVKPLEGEYPPLRSLEAVRDVKWLVVLSGGSGVDKALPLSTYLSEASLKSLSKALFDAD